MKIDLETLAKIVEERIPTAKTTCVPKVNQIVVVFTNRPDVEVALLTPWLQRKVLEGSVTNDELFNLLWDLNSIANS